MNKKHISIILLIILIIFSTLIILLVKNNNLPLEENNKVYNEYNEQIFKELKSKKYLNLTLKNINDDLLNILENINTNQLKIYVFCENKNIFFEKINKTKSKNLYIIDDCGDDYQYNLTDYENLVKWTGETLVIDSLNQKIDSKKANILSKIKVSNYVEIAIDSNYLTDEIIEILKSSKTVKKWSPTVIFYNK